MTGSGKTEVYIQAIQEVVAYGRQAIVLVPEISLTPQTVERFRARFDHVAVLHSHLTDAERHLALATNRRRAEVSGRRRRRAARSSPRRRNLGLIVLDEEHENVVQAGNRAAVSRPRCGPGTCAGRRGAVGARFGHAFARELAPGATGEYQMVEMPRRVFDRPLPDVRNDRLAKRSRPRSARAGHISRPLHWRCRMRWPTVAR